jgi:transcriptional regulator with XRE-family HTH domain
MSFTHQQLWKGIDTLAQKKDCSLCELSIKAGIDKTTLGKSRRFTKAGRERWLSVETLFKVLKAANVSFLEFALMIEKIEKEQEA